MATLKAGRHVKAMEVTEGAGVTVHRTIGIRSMRNLDPFMMLDQISSDNPDKYMAGFPDHPHRGFNTFTYMIDGDMEHKDSMGNTGRLGSGGAQWMKAASGVIHSEMPKQEDGLMRGFQLWINLPSAHKMDAPEYQEYTAEAFPIIEDNGITVKVLVGAYADVVSPIVDDITEVRYLDVQLEPGTLFHCELPQDHNSFLYVFEGDGTVDTRKAEDKMLVTLSGSDTVFVAGDKGARLLVISGKPIREPVAQYGPFVMNTREEVEQAMHDYQSNSFVRDRAWVNRNNEPQKAVSNG